MFQRLKGAIDSTIAAEQARQRASQSTPSRSNSGAKKPLSRAASPAVRSTRTKQVERKEGEGSQNGPDPTEFEPRFVIEDDDTPSRASTPRPILDKAQDGTPDEPLNEKATSVEEQQASENITEGNEAAKTPELPPDVRLKLRKLEKLESRYQELLRSYRIAHARVSAIEPFETSLRENTPLTSINDPAALVEYLNQLNLKGDMVLDELKRVSAERDNFKQKLAEAEKSAREAWDDVTALREPKPNQGDVNERPGSSETPMSNGADKSPTQSIALKEAPKREPSEATVKSPLAPAKSRTSSIPSISLFSPKTKAVQEQKADEQAEEFFSYDSELPKLQHELKKSQVEVTELQNEVKAVKGDLAVARESTQSIAKTLEDSTSELNLLKERGDECEAELKEQRTTAEDTVRSLKEDLQVANGRLQEVETQQRAQITEHISELEERLQEAKSELDAMHRRDAENSESGATIERLQREINALEAEVSVVQNQKDLSQKRVETLNGLVSNLREQLLKAEHNEKQLRLELSDKTATVSALQDRMTLIENNTLPKGENTTEANGVGNKSGLLTPGEGRSVDTRVTGDGHTAAKKKNKKKKKGGKATVEADGPAHLDSPTTVGDDQEPTADTPTHLLQNDTVSRLQQELDHLRSLLEEKDAAIERLHGKLKNGEDMQEEIDSLRDDLVLVGQDHVRARDQIKDLKSEKSSLQTTASNLEMEIADLKAAHASNKAGSEQVQRDLAAQLEDLKVKATTLETDVSIAQQLASSRFKDITDLRNILQKVQPELVALKNEVTEVRTVKEELQTKSTVLQQIEAKHEIIQAELDHMKRTIADKDAEIKLLNHKSRQDVLDKLKAEEATEKSSQELQQSENEKLQLGQSLDRVSKDLNKYQEDLRISKVQLRELEESTSKLLRDNDELKEELELKTAQYASAESLMSSMRDQSTEMAMQAKEARERCDNLEEEVADAHRLLGERSREGETMRRLLAEVEGRTESRVREMKERMDTAVEERDRAEDEASTVGRRRARELEEVKNKLKDVERSLKRSEEDKEELEAAQRDWKRRREGLEQRAEQSSHEVEEVRRAMSELRDALDESERQARELEKQKVELRRLVEDTQNRLDKLQKSNKSMADEARLQQATKTKGMESEAPSSRSSLESTPSKAKFGSPVPKVRTGSATVNDLQNSPALGSMDYVYLKNVLLQFLEQRDKKHQMQLIPVLGMLLRFDRKDEQKWMAAITTK